MKIPNGKIRFTLTNLPLIGLWAAALVFTFACATIARAQAPGQLFPSPEEATRALVAATQTKDKGSLARIFGPRLRELLSGDPVADANGFAAFSAFISEGTKLEKESDQKVTLVIGNDEWPFPVPLVKASEQWRFDTDTGVEEILNRRIGENEIDAALLCQAYVLAQDDYFNNGDWDEDQVAEYAQKLLSSPGKKDGLYWEAVGDEEESPLGPLVAYAVAEGYTRKKGAATQTAAPFHGYYFKVLTRQGPSAPGGKHEYIINGNMIAGFGLVAYPAKWSNSGVMSFIVNQEGRVYEKNLGPQTAEIAAAITEYNPDVSWKLVRDE